MRFFQRTIWILSTTVLSVCLLACSPGKDNPTADGGLNQSNQPATQHSFKCSAPNLLQGLVKTIHFDGDRASEESEPYVGAFSTGAIAFEMQSGTRELVKLDESMYFTSKKPGSHDGCEKFSWYKAGTLVFLEFLGAGGNPYPPQQLLFLDEASQAFKPAAQLHPLLGQDFIEFERDGCLAGLRHGDGLAHRICFQDSALVLKSALMEERYQANAWHTFLCDFSDGRVDVSEYRVKSSALDETAELDPLGSKQKMLVACDLFLTKFNEQTTHLSSKRDTN